MANLIKFKEVKMKFNHLFHRIYFKIGRFLTDQYVVLQLRNSSGLDFRKFNQEEVFEFENIEDIPIGVLETLESSLGHDWLAVAEDIFSKGGAILTVLLLEGRLATISWIQNGAVIPEWIIPLSDDDYVFSRGYTVPDFRGRGCYARCIATGYDSISLKRGRLLTACHICNTPSIRQFKRSGFEIVARSHFKN